MQGADAGDAEMGWEGEGWGPGGATASQLTQVRQPADPAEVPRGLVVIQGPAQAQVGGRMHSNTEGVMVANQLQAMHTQGYGHQLTQRHFPTQYCIPGVCTM